MAVRGSFKVSFRGIINGISKEDFDRLGREYDRLKENQRIFVSEVQWSDAKGINDPGRFS